LSCAFGLAGAPAEALTVAIEVTITNSLTPTDPTFPDASLGGTVEFTEVILGDPIVFAPIGDPIAIPPIGPGQTFPIDPILPPNPIQPGDPILVSFTGTLGNLFGDFPAFFFPIDPILPADPPATAPLVNLGAFTAGVTALHATGPVIAFDDPILVGTWEVTVRAVPAPASLALLVMGVGGLALVRRRRRR